MKTISITFNQLGLIIISATSIPLTTFVLGIIFSTHQPTQTVSVAAEAIAQTENLLPDNALPDNLLTGNVKSSDLLHENPGSENAQSESTEPAIDEAHAVNMAAAQSEISEMSDTTISAEPAKMENDLVETKTHNPYLAGYLSSWQRTDRFEEFSFTDDSASSLITSEQTISKLTTSEQTTPKKTMPEQSLPEQAMHDKITSDLSTPQPTPSLAIKKEMKIPALKNPTRHQETTSSELPEYALQIGVFSEKKRAVEWAKSIEKNVVKVQVFSNHKANGQMLYSVITGLFEDKAAARLSGEQLKKNHQLNYFVTTSETLGHEVFRANSSYVIASVF